MGAGGVTKSSQVLQIRNLRPKKSTLVHHPTSNRERSRGANLANGLLTMSLSQKQPRVWDPVTYTVKGALLKRKNITWQMEHNLKISSGPERGRLWATHSYTVSNSFNVIFKWEGTDMLVLHLKINNNEMKIKETRGRPESLYYEPWSGCSTCFPEVWGCGFPNKAKKWFWDDFHWAGSRLSGQENFHFFCVVHVGSWL